MMKWYWYALIILVVVVSVGARGMYMMNEAQKEFEYAQSFTTLGAGSVEIISVNTDGYAYATNNTEYSAYFKQYSNWGDGVKYCVDVNGTEKCLIYQPQDMSYRDVYGSQDYLGSINNVQAQINGSTITYPNAFSNVDLTYTMNKYLIKENFILNSQPRQPASYLTPPITLDFGGYIKYENDITLWDNGVEITGKNWITSNRIDFKVNNQTVFFLPKPEAYSSGEYADLINLQYEIKKQGNQIWFYVKTPVEILSTWQYPIFIDPSPSVPLNETLIACLDFEGDANDILEVHNGTVTGATLDTTDYKLGTSSYKFDGNSDYITLANSGDFNFLTGEFTFSAWIKRNGTLVTDFPAIFGKGDTGSGEVMTRVYKSDGTIESYGDGGSLLFSHQTKITDTNWHHVVLIRYSSTETRVWLDGVLSTAFDGSAWSLNNAKSLTIGGADGSASRWWTGNIDEFAVWNTALNDSQIAELYNSGTGFTCAEIVGGGGSPPASSNNWVDCTSNPATNETKEYNSSFFVNGTGNWSIAHDITLNSFNFTDTCGLIIHNSGSLTLK